MTSWNDERAQRADRSVAMGSFILLAVFVVIGVLCVAEVNGQVATPTPTATLHMSATSGALPVATPTPTLQVVAETPTILPTLTILPRPSATRIPSKDCSLQIGGSCKVWLSVVWLRNQRSGEVQ